jgi:hypothetical protein
MLLEIFGRMTTSLLYPKNVQHSDSLYFLKPGPLLLDWIKISTLFIVL